MPEQFHLNLSLWTPGQLRTSWRLPGRDPLAYVDVENYRRLVAIAQQAKADAVLLGDSPSLGSVADSPPQGLDPTIADEVGDDESRRSPHHRSRIAPHPRSEGRLGGARAG